MSQLDEVNHIESIRSLGARHFFAKCNSGCAGFLRDVIDEETLKSWSIVTFDFKNTSEEVRIFVDPTCHKKASVMFLSRRQFLLPFLASKKMPAGCPDCPMCGARQQETRVTSLSRQ
jgi:hypothetical protein